MNVGTQNLIYDRRRALFTRSNSSYIQMSLDSRNRQDSDEEWDVSSSSAISTISAKSVKSYKTWRRAQRERRKNLKKTKSLGHDVSEKTLEALDLSGDFGTLADKEKMKNTRAPIKTALVDAGKSADGRILSNVDEDNRVPTSIHQAVEPYYSSSPLTTSSDESQSATSPQRSSSLTIDDLESDISDQIRKTYIKRDPLQRRSYPFILPEIYSPERKEILEEDLPKYCFRPLALEISKESYFASDAGFNSVISLESKSPKGRSLLALSRSKSLSLSMEEQIYEETVAEKDVVITDQHGFTLSVPVHSPSAPSSMSAGDNLPAKTDDVTIENEKIESSERQGVINSNSGENTINKDGSGAHEEENVSEKVKEMLDHYPDPHFLPPLIAAAVSNKSLEKLDITKERDRNASVETPSPEIHSSSDLFNPRSTSTAEEDLVANTDDVTMKEEKIDECDKLEGSVSSVRENETIEENDPSVTENEIVDDNKKEILDNYPDLQFLPPLIATAVSNKSLDKLDITKERDKNANLKESPSDAYPSSEHSNSSTEEELEANIYLENADNIFEDFAEKEFLGVPKAEKEISNFSDADSAVTSGSRDPIEDILTREDDVRADNRTFTLNGRAVITPKSEEDRERIRQMLNSESPQVENPAIENDHQDEEKNPVVGAEEQSTSDHETSDAQVPKQHTDVSDICPDFCCVIL